MARVKDSHPKGTSSPQRLSCSAINPTKIPAKDPFDPVIFQLYHHGTGYGPPVMVLNVRMVIEFKANVKLRPFYWITVPVVKWNFIINTTQNIKIYFAL
jgi:hypothetical protein